MDQELAEGGKEARDRKVVCAGIWPTYVQPKGEDSRAFPKTHHLYGLCSFGHFHAFHTFVPVKSPSTAVLVLHAGGAMVFVLYGISFRIVLPRAFHDAAVHGRSGFGLRHLLY